MGDLYRRTDREHIKKQRPPANELWVEDWYTDEDIVLVKVERCDPQTLSAGDLVVPAGMLANGWGTSSMSVEQLVRDIIEWWESNNG